MLVAALVLGALADRKADQKFKTSFPALILGILRRTVPSSVLSGELRPIR
jgi:hypothetical protein